MAGTLVFIPAWNEEGNLPAVLDELRRALPDADVLVVDDGSTDRTADVAREHGAEVLSFGGGESKLKGKKAFVLVVTVIATLLGARRFQRRRA